MKEFFENIKNTYRNYQKAITIMMVCIFLQQMLMVTIPYITGEIVDLLSSKSLDSFLPIVGLACLALLGHIFAKLISWQKEKVNINSYNFDLNKDNYMNGMNHYLGLSGGQHMGENSEKRRSAIDKGANASTNLSHMFFHEILPDIFRTVVVFSALLIFDPIIGSILLALFVLNIVLQILTTKNMMKSFDEWQMLGKERDKIVGEHTRNVLLTKSVGQESEAEDEIEQAFDRSNDHAKKLWTKFIKSLLIISSSVPFAATGVSLILAWGVFIGNFSIGHFVFVSMWAGMAVSQAWTIQRYQRRIMQLLPAFRDLKKELRVKSDIEIAKNPISGIIQDGKIEFKDVSFSYQDKDFELNNLSVVIEPGEKIGIAGISGSGKSTFVNLLLRNYDPISGQVLVDDNDLRLIDLQEYKNTSVGHVDQSILLFDRTVRYNLGYPGGKISEDDMKRALKIANLYDRVMKHKDGLDAKIGERGVKLSGGERQRLAIARAIIKNPKILIFDEATASLDAKNESEIQNAIDKASKGRTMIAIAHRLATIQNADKILFFEKGRLSAVGTHLELLNKSKAYGELCSHQNLRIA
ncbi:MAG: ABC transporter ATP-binding protein/permease [Candidatus Nomurabacteria bacterium]|nr:ABC transporter ATP-binding protein/permease [Candidatus Nomurabacteria bacterium]